MTKEELLKYAETEFQWLKYYSYIKSKETLDLSKPISIYEQLVSIGYTKRVIPLHIRCAFVRVTSDTSIDKNTPYESMIFTDLPRDSSNNIYTAAEVWIIKHPELHTSIKEMLLA